MTGNCFTDNKVPSIMQETSLRYNMYKLIHTFNYNSGSENDEVEGEMNYNGLNSYTSEQSSQTSISSLCNFFTGIACLCLWEFQFRAWRRKTYVHCLQLWRLLEFLQVSIHIEFLIDLSRIIKIQLDFNCLHIYMHVLLIYCSQLSSEKKLHYEIIPKGKYSLNAALTC